MVATSRRRSSAVMMSGSRVAGVVSFSDSLLTLHTLVIYAVRGMVRAGLIAARD